MALADLATERRRVLVDLSEKGELAEQPLESGSWDDSAFRFWRVVIPAGGTFAIGNDCCGLIETAARTLVVPKGINRRLPDSAGFIFFEREVTSSRFRAIHYGYVTLRDEGLPGLAICALNPDGHLVMSTTGVDECFLQTDDAEVSDLIAAFEAFWLFVSQRILKTVTQPLSRAARRRLRQPDASTQIICLRSIEYRDASSMPIGLVDWNCRWLVRGHWRQQWHQTTQTHHPKWILPYVKGPDDKPFKEPRATVYAVVR